MLKQRTINALTFAGLVWASPCWVLAQAPRVEPVRDWQSVLPNSSLRIEYRVVGPKATRLSWELRARHRIVARGSAPVKKKDDGRRAIVELRAPRLEEEVSFDFELHTWLEDAKGDALSKPNVKRFWVLADDPFAGRRRWLETLGIVVFDPKKDTIAQLEKAKIPMSVVRGLDALEATAKGVVIVGEGTSFESNRALSEILWSLALKGCDVLVLSPEHGTVFPASPGDENRMSQLRSVRLGRREVITQFDKRLDATQWLSFDVPCGGLVATFNKSDWTVDAVGNGDEDKGQGWSWIDMPLKKPGGRVLLCNFPIIQQWDRGPTPRYLFWCLLENMRQTQNKKIQPLLKEKP